MAKYQWKLIWQNEDDNDLLSIHENVSPYQEIAIEKRERMLVPITKMVKGKVVKVWPSVTWTVILKEKVYGR